MSQKHIVVTCNYEARAQGVTKLMSIPKARALCHQLVLRCGEDLTPYRAASKQIGAVLRRYGVAEQLGMDETALDVTAKAQGLSEGQAQCAVGHWHRAGQQLEGRCLNGTVMSAYT